MADADQFFEFEPPLLGGESNGDNDDPVKAGAAGGGPPWGGLVVLGIVGALLAALFWIDSQAEDEVVEPAAGDGQVLPDSGSGSSDAPLATALEPLSDVVVLNGELLGKRVDVRVPSPPISRSVDGSTWTEVQTRTIIGGNENEAPFAWSSLKVTESGLSILAFSPEVAFHPSMIVGFSSTDGVEWVEEGRFTQDGSIGAPIATGSAGLIAAVPQPGRPERDLAVFDVHVECREIVDAAADFGVVSVESGGGSRTDIFGGAFLFDRRLGSDTFPTLLPGDRVAVIDVGRAGERIAGCSELVPELSEPAFRVGNFEDGLVESFVLPIDERFDPATARFLGESPLGANGSFLFMANDSLWVLDTALGQWRVFSDLTIPAASADVVVSSSGNRVYYFDEDELVTLDLFDSDAGRLTLGETRQARERITEGVEPLSSTIVFASDDVVVATDEVASWTIPTQARPDIDAGTDGFAMSESVG